MASINDVYGKNYQRESVGERVAYAVKLLASNIAHKNFVFNYDSNVAWNGNNMKKEAIDLLMTQVKSINPKFRAVHIPKTSPKINMFKYLINGSVEYFIVTDLSGEEGKIYSVYITPTKMEPY